MPPDEDSSCIWILLHGVRHPRGQVLFVRRILDDGHFERIEESEGFTVSSKSDALDHLLVGYTETLGIAG